MAILKSKVYIINILLQIMQTPIRFKTYTFNCPETELVWKKH